MKLKEIIQNLEKSKADVEKYNKLIEKTLAHTQKVVSTQYHSVGYFYEFGSMKFYVKNNDGHKTILFWSDFPELFKSLKALKKQMEEAELTLKDGKEDRDEKTRPKRN